MKLKFPKLLRREYLNRSPIWRSYLSTPITSPYPLPLQLFKTNIKLFTAYIVSECVKDIEKEKEKDSKRKNQLMKEYWSYVEKQKQRYKESKIDGYGIEWNEEFFQKIDMFWIANELRGKDQQKYLQALNQMYSNILKKYGQTHKQQHYISIHKTPLQPQSPTPPPFPTTSTPFTSYLHSLHTLSLSHCLSDIDLVILGTTSPSFQYFPYISAFKPEWSEKYKINQKMVLLLKDILLGGIVRECKGNGANGNVRMLGDALGKFRGFCEENRADMGNRLLMALDWIMDKDVGKGNFDATELKEFNIHYKLGTSASSQSWLFPNTNISYLEIIAVQYILYLDWLSMKTLYQQQQSKFISHTEYFLEKLQLLKITDIFIQSYASNNNKKKPQLQKEQKKEERALEIGQIRQLSDFVEIAKLEILSQFYNFIVDTGKISHGGEENTKDGKSFEKIILTLTTKIQQRQTLLAKSLKPPKKPKNPQTPLPDLSEKLHQVTHLLTLLHPHLTSTSTSTPPSLKVKLALKSLSNPTLQKMLEKTLEQLMKINIILLSKRDIVALYRVLGLGLEGNWGNVKGKGKIQEYGKKLEKYAQVQMGENGKNMQTIEQQRNKLQEQQYNNTNIKSIQQSKQLWKKLITISNRQKLSILKENIFLLSSTSTSTSTSTSFSTKIEKEKVKSLDLSIMKSLIDFYQIQ